VIGGHAGEEALSSPARRLVLHAYFDNGARQLGLEFGGGVVGDDAPIIDDGYAIGQPIRLFEILWSGER